MKEESVIQTELTWILRNARSCTVPTAQGFSTLALLTF